MGQDPKDLTLVTCDVTGCGKQLAPMEKHVRLQTWTLFSGSKGAGVFICRPCLIEKFGIDPAVLDA